MLGENVNGNPVGIMSMPEDSVPVAGLAGPPAMDQAPGMMDYREPTPPAFGPPPAPGPTGNVMMPAAAGPAPGMQPPQMAYPGPPPGMQPPVGEVANDGAHSLGVSILAVGIGAALGAKYGGGVGTAVAGALAGGALANGVRAYRHFMDGTDEGETEAKISATYALGSGGLAAYLWTKFEEAETAKQAPQLPAAADDEALPGDVGIRPVGP